MLPETPEPPEAGAPPWLVTFSDMATLMLCYFVLLFAFSRADAQTSESALESVRRAFGGEGAPAAGANAVAVPTPDAPSRASPVSERSPRPPDVARVRALLAQRGLLDRVDVSQSARGVVVRARDHILFESGQAALGPEATPVLDAIRELVRHFDGRLAVEGHTDDRPIHSELYPSNWELSAARSAAVLRYLVDHQVDPRRVHVTGYADALPIADNDSEAGRARNRRVEFVFEN